jgi:hypothetical protein
MKSKRAWSERSQRDLLRQCALQDELEGCKALEIVSKARIAKLKEESEAAIAAVAKLALNPDAVANRTFRPDPTKDLELLEAEKHTHAAILDRIASLEVQIQRLANPDSREKADRKRAQESLARLARRRRRHDRLVDEARRTILQLVKRREELTAEMKAAATKADLTVLPDGLDESRFDRLLESLLLMEELEPKSARWLDWFLGKGNGNTTTYTVRRPSLVLPETLASSNTYRFGEEVQLTDEQASEILSGAHRNNPPIVSSEALYGASGTRSNKSETMKIEILSTIDHGVMDQHTVYEPGIYELPRKLALEFLLKKLAVPAIAGRESEGGQTALARAC